MSIKLLDDFLITQHVDSLELHINRDLIKFGAFVLYIILLSSLIGEIWENGLSKELNKLKNLLDLSEVKKFLNSIYMLNEIWYILMAG